MLTLQDSRRFAEIKFPCCYLSDFCSAAARKRDGDPKRRDASCHRNILRMEYRLGALAYMPASESTPHQPKRRLS